MPELSIKHALRGGWEYTKRHFLLLSGLLIAIMLLTLSEIMPNNTVVSIINIFVSLYLGICYLYIILSVTDGFKPSKDVLKKASTLFVNFLVVFLFLIIVIGAGAMVCMGLAFLIGTTLDGILQLITALVLSFTLIVFLILYVFPMLLFVPLSLVDGKGPLEAIAHSWRTVHPIRWKVVLLPIVVALINLAGFLAFVIGVFITIPLTSFATAIIYRQISPKEDPDKGIDGMDDAIISDAQ